MRWLTEALGALEAQGQLRTPTVLGEPQGPKATIRGKSCVVFCSNDYLGLKDHPTLLQAASEALRHGVGSGASRLISGNLSLHERAEQSLASLVGLPAALLGSSGYAMNVGALACLLGPEDVVYSDQLNHASLIDGLRLSRARVRVFPHGDTDALRQLVSRENPCRRRWVVTESLFSMDGDLCPIEELQQLSLHHDLLLYTDEAHAIGVLGPRGQGLCRARNIVPAVLLGTLGKALGGSGAFLAGSPELRAWLWNRCRSTVFSTAVTPSAAAVALAAATLAPTLDTLRARLSRHRRRLGDALKRLGIPSGGDPETPIVPIPLKDERATLTASQRLLERGLFLQAIRPPTVPRGGSRLRLTLSAAHTDEDIDALLHHLPACLP
ncbi:MAG: 8-amino-7-oxononanoate synthase [Deltaproteobacteria bacterium]|nr:8-amino-7-oxononanoate synthase [Deltaproteobacteria bacterium]